MQSDILSLFYEQNIFIKEFEKTCKSSKIPIISRSTGYFLEFAVCVFKPSNILEIGCGNGFSSYYLIKNMKDNARYTGIDLNRKRLFSAENMIADKFPGINTEFLHGNALKLIPELSIKYDMVFIDAAKFEYPLYLIEIIHKIKKGTLIIADNIFCKNKIFSESPEKHFKNSIKGIKEYLIITGGKMHFKTSILGIGDGLALSVYKGGT